MGEPYVGEIRMFGGSFAPQGWMFCDGSLLAIADYDVLFNLIGTTYGGDGQDTFALPDLRGRVPVHQGSSGAASYVIGEMAGQETVTLTSGQIPSHTHLLRADAEPAESAKPGGNHLAQTDDDLYAAPPPAVVPLHPSSIGLAGGNQAHTNMQPYLAISFIISLFGVYPSQN